MDLCPGAFYHPAPDGTDAGGGPGTGRERVSFPRGSEEGRMVMRNSFRYCVPLILLWFSTFFFNPQLQAQIIINEFMADPARVWEGDVEHSSRDDEWVEVINVGNADVDLAVDGHAVVGGVQHVGGHGGGHLAVANEEIVEKPVIAPGGDGQSRHAQADTQAH